MTADALSPRESTRLKKCEAVIERGLQTFVEVGNALLEIRDSRLYRQDFGTFDDYCRERWGMEKSQTYRLMDAAKVVSNLSPIGELPTHESQVRPLTKLEPEEQREVWDETVKNAPNGKPTAKDVDAAVDRFKAPSKSDDPVLSELKNLKKQWRKLTRTLVEEFGAIIGRHGLGCAIEFTEGKVGEVDEVIETECGWLKTALVDRATFTIRVYNERNRRDERITSERDSDSEPTV